MKLKLLLVEDHEPIHELFQAFLGDEYDLDYALTGTKGYSLASQNYYDLIISDLNLPEMEGLTMMRKLRENGVNTPFIVITGHNTIKNELDSFRLGALDFLVKPFGFDSVSRILTKFKKNFSYSNNIKSSKFVNLYKKDISFVLNSVMDEIYNYVEILLNEIKYIPNISERDILILKVTLIELITNAIEHGNAGITYDEKQNLIKQDETNYIGFINSICEKNNKKVTINISYTPEQVEMIIQDEGNGFNLKSIPDPTKNSMVNLVSGRGIFIAKLNIDSLTYNEKGNIATAIRRLDKKF